MKMTRVLAFGTFDILHEGHKYYLREASRFGDELIVIVALDETVMTVKGRYPKQKQSERLKAVSKLDFVSKAVLGNDSDQLARIKETKPDVICLGYDQTSFTNNLSEHLIRLGLKAKIVRLKPYKPHKYKSSKLSGESDSAK